MNPYDESVEYLGPQNSWLTRYIPKFPITCEVLKPSWNKVAYEHDVAYQGDEYAGFCGWVKKWFNRKQVNHERGVADTKFFDGLKRAIYQKRDELTDIQEAIAFEYATVCYKAVKRYGWAFYRVGDI